MKTKKFIYEKEDYEKEYNIAVLNEDKEYIKGISLNNLSDNEREEFYRIQEEYECKLKPFMKAFKQFKVNKIKQFIG